MRNYAPYINVSSVLFVLNEWLGLSYLFAANKFFIFALLVKLPSVMYKYYQCNFIKCKLTMQFAETLNVPRGFFYSLIDLFVFLQSVINNGIISHFLFESYC